MARKPPTFDLPSSDGAAATGWVYRSSGSAAKATSPARAPRRARAKRAAATPVVAKSAAAKPGSHHARAHNIVRRYAAASAGASLVPVPFADMAAVGAVHTLMVRALAAEYGVTSSKRLARAAIGAVSGPTTRWAGAALRRSAVKVIPGVGHAAAALALPASVAAATYAIGRIFIAHFEKGGGLEELASMPARAR